ncbi:GAF domain-containing protein [Goodfellowiella coeruleoviolacea]|uniref:GAF domain-containing protein n=1 Tax=Goodfellowiella coeruleoviolacea TaxID=334858 RepID=A0AAE3KK33_9PSEU|nr:GAF domain-containing protein [Goodfellowiella coeruleoviolacea]MCP2165008.1 GAF domain-containing protein [Goodfellowiella coeruleoviolacea]
MTGREDGTDQRGGTAYPAGVAEVFAEVEARVRAAVGVRLFTVLAWLPGRRVLHRAHTSHPEQYPVGGEKSVEVAAGWLERCVHGQRPYLGADRAAVREIFSDHELIDALGCGAVINVPVVDDGRTLGVLNILDAEGRYDDAAVTRAAQLAALAVPALRAVVARRDRPAAENPTQSGGPW